LYSSLNIVKMKSRMIKRAGQAACIGEFRNACKIFVGRTEGKRRFGRPRRRWRTILKWILRKYNGRVWTGLTKDRERWWNL
jgi:hypothetical protein